MAKQRPPRQPPALPEDLQAEGQPSTSAASHEETDACEPPSKRQKLSIQIPVIGVFPSSSSGLVLPASSSSETLHLACYELSFVKLLEHAGAAKLSVVRSREGQLFVLKEVDPRSRQLSIQDTARELSLGERLVHENIVTTYGGEYRNGRMCILLEYAELGDVHEYAKKHFPSGMPEAEATSIVEQVAQGLASMHAEEIWHCDLKPENLLVFRKDTQLHIKIADLGACAYGATPSSARGTAGYLPPEMVFGAAADVWSLGIIFYRLLTGRLPFSGVTELETQLLAKSGRFDMPSGLSARSADLLKGMLKVDPAERWTLAKVLSTFS